MLVVWERVRSGSSGWFRSPGLTGIPDHLRAQAEEAVAERNAALGYTCYMITPDIGSWHEDHPDFDVRK